MSKQNYKKTFEQFKSLSDVFIVAKFIKVSIQDDIRGFGIRGLKNRKKPQK